MRTLSLVFWALKLRFQWAGGSNLPYAGLKLFSDTLSKKTLLRFYLSELKMLDSSKGNKYEMWRGLAVA